MLCQLSWVTAPLFLRQTRCQVSCVAAASHAASFERQWPMMRGKRHDKIVQLHQKGTSREGEVGARSSLYQEWMAEGVEPCFRYDPIDP